MSEDKKITPHPKPILMNLTGEQMKAIAGHCDHLGTFEIEQGKLGMLVAQVDRTHMLVGLVTPTNAKKIKEALGSSNDRIASVKLLYDEKWKDA